MGVFSNSTCPLPKDDVNRPNTEEPIMGDIHFQRLLFYIAGGFSAITIILCLFLAVSHLACYVRPREQRQIIRIAFYPVVYSLLCCFSILDYPASRYLLPATSFYEPVALMGIFFLFVEFAHDDPSTRDDYFSQLEHKRKTGSRFKKGGWVTVPGGSLRWYHAKWVAVYFYFLVTIIMTVVELTTQAAGRYCEWSFSPAFAHFWVVIIQNIVLPIGVLAVVHFYIRLSFEPHVKAHRPTLKILAFKGILLLNFVQEIVFQILIGANVFKNHPKITIQDQAIGIQQCLVCLDMMLVAIAYQFSYQASEYRVIQRQAGGRPMNIFQAAANALNPSDLVVGAAYTFHLVASGVGPVGNGSWRRSGGYEKMRGSGSGAAGFNDIAGHTRNSEDVRMGRLQYQRAPSTAYQNTPPAYDDARPLRSSSPYGYTNPQRSPTRSPSPDSRFYKPETQPYSTLGDNTRLHVPNSSLDHSRPSYDA